MPRWANWDHFNELDRKGLAMYGQTTAGSLHRRRASCRAPTRLSWKWAPALGGDLTEVAVHQRPRRHGRCTALAAVMAGASCLAVECRKSSIDMRLRTGYLDTWTDNLDEALRMIDESCKAGTPKSVGLLGNVADVLAELLKRGVKPDLLTDQTSARPGERLPAAGLDGRTVG